MIMTDFSFLNLYVKDNAVSANFYNELLDIPIIEEKEGFSLLPLKDGVMLGLWMREAVEPETNEKPGANEIAFAVANPEAVENLHSKWSERGLTITQEPTVMSFGATFVALDPDGHRLRVFAPQAA
jgi:predicted lactoylglutathione lyase